MKREHRIGLALAALVLSVVGFLVHPYRAQQASRYALTAAVAEDGTIVLDDYADVIGIDRSVRDGHIYSDKAPGQPFLAVPFHLVYQAVSDQDSKVLQIDGNLGLWWQTLWFAALPLAVLAYLMYRGALRESPGALGGALALVFGTLLLPFGALLFGHVLSAAFVYGAWLIVSRTEPQNKVQLLMAGGLVGLSVITEYTAILASVVVVAVAFARHRARFGWLLIGGGPFAVLLAVYNNAAFGSPTALSYSYTAFTEVTETARPIGAMFSSFQPSHFRDLLISPRGFLYASPIVFVALVVALGLAFRKGHRINGVVPLLVFALYFLIPMFWGNPWGGDSPGPRYMVPALPFLAVPAAVAWERFKIPTALAAVLSVVTMLAATITDPMLGRDGDWGLNVWGRQVLAGEFVPTWFEVILGGFGWLVPVLVVLAAWKLTRTARRIEVA